MKNPVAGKKVSSYFFILLIAIALILVFSCVFGYFCIINWKSEKFENGCVRENNFNDPNFRNERFFHYDNINRIVPSDPIHMTREDVESVMFSDGDSGCAKKKRQ